MAPIPILLIFGIYYECSFPICCAKFKHSSRVYGQPERGHQRFSKMSKITLTNEIKRDIKSLVINLERYSKNLFKKNEIPPDSNFPELSQNKK